MLGDDIIQRLTVEHLHGDVHHVRIAIEVVDGRDRRVRQRLGFTCFALQRDHHRRVQTVLIVEHLECDVRVAILSFFLAQVFGQVHHTHATSANDAFDNKSILDHGTHGQLLAVCGGSRIGWRESRRVDDGLVVFALLSGDYRFVRVELITRLHYERAVPIIFASCTITP